MSLCRTGNIAVAAGIISFPFLGGSALALLGELIIFIAMLLFMRRVWFQLSALGRSEQGGSAQRRSGAHRA
jgi:hypothetical protein